MKIIYNINQASIKAFLLNNDVGDYAYTVMGPDRDQLFLCVRHSTGAQLHSVKFHVRGSDP